MSKTPRDLLRRHGAPLPRAATVEAEVRTESIIPFVTVTAPESQTGIVFGALHEWRSRLSGAALVALRTFLTTGPTLPEMLISNWMTQKNLGGLLGVFLETGGGGAVVRVLFAYTKADLSREDINKQWAALVENPQPAEQDASAAIIRLRKIMIAGQDFTDSGLLALSTLDFGKVVCDRASMPFQSVDFA